LCRGRTGRRRPSLRITILHHRLERERERDLGLLTSCTHNGRRLVQEKGGGCLSPIHLFARK
jgi:hypothetical protein